MLAEAAAVFDTNLFGAARVAGAVLPHMRACGRGRIVNVGSPSAWIGEPGEGDYAASKAALARYTAAGREARRQRHCAVPCGRPRTAHPRGAVCGRAVGAAVSGRACD